MKEQVCKILIIGDCVEDRVKLRYYLERNKNFRYEFLEAEVINAGVEICRSEKPNCILLDYNLPDGNGLSLMREINPDPLNPEFPIVLLTGSGSEVIAVNALKNGAQDYLVKGKITPEDLHLSIQKAVENVSLRSERLIALEELRQSETRLKLGIKVADCEMIEVNYSDNTAHISEGGARLFGLGDEEMTVPRERLHATFHPDDREELARLIKKSLNPDGDGWFDKEHRIALENGEVRWLSVRKQIFFDRKTNPPRPTHGILVAQDITERKRNEEKLRISEERLSIAMKGAQLGTFDLNIKTGEVLWSREIEELSGISPDDFNNTLEGLINFIHPLDREMLQNRIEEAFKTGEYECKFRMLKGDGTIRWVIGKGSVIYDEAGEPARLIGVDIDITKRKAAEEELRESQRFTESIIETAPSVLYTFNINTLSPTFMTKQSANALGYEFEELKNAASGLIQSLMHPGDVETTTKHFEKIKRVNSNEVFENEYRMRHKSGEWRWFRSRDMVFKRDEAGNAEEILGVALDITERRLAEEKLRESQIQTHLALEAGNTIAFTWDIESDRIQRLHSGIDALPETENDTLSGVATRIYEPDRERFLANIKNALANPNLPYNFEYRIFDPDQKISWLNETGRFTLGENGKPVSLTGISTDITERKRTEEQLRESSERLMATYTHAPIGIVETSLDGSYINVNDEFCHLTGYTKDELLKLKIKDLTHPDDFPTNLELFNKLVAGEISSFQLEKRYVRKDGSTVWAEVNRTLIRNTVGEPSYVIGAIIDITERKNSAEQLRRNHETFFNLVQNAPFGIYVVDADFRLIQISKGSRKVFGNIESPIGRDFAEILRIIWEEPFASEAIEHFRHTLATGEPYRASNTTEQRNDIEETESYDWKIERISLPDGRLGVVCYFYDLTERLQFEEKLRESEKRMHLVLRAAKIGIWIYDLQNQKIEWSPEHYELFGTEEFDGTIEAFKRFIHPDDLENVLRQFEESINNGTPYQPEFRIIRPEGEIRWVGNFGHAEYDLTGSAIRFLGTVFDITERKNAEFERLKMLEREKELRREAEYANQSKDEFLAILSHELRTPLNSMSGWVHILLKNDLDAATSRKAVEVIARNVTMQNTLIEDLLDVSRIISGKMQLEIERVSFISVIESSLDAVRLFAENRLIKIELNLDPAADEIIGDKHRLQQIIGNLLTNAIKFSPENRTITITLSHIGNTAKFAVKDEGIGISKELLPNVFDRFRQADATSKRKYSGLGLGLTIVKHLVELHGGTISAFSDGENSGSEFVVEIPLAVPINAYTGQGSENYPFNPRPENEISLTGTTILLVDDNQESLDLLCFVFEQKGAKVVCLSRADEALEEIRRNNFDLLISDLGMPEMDGFDLIRELRKMEKETNESLPAIALTGYVSTEDQERVLNAGFQTHLCKPVDIENLCRIARDLIKK